MPTLRLRQTSVAESRHRVEAELEGQTAVSEFSFSLSPQQQEDLRWYLEDFLTYPLDPAPAIAARIEADMAQIGEQLFAEVFRTDDARDMWATLRPELGVTRIEISTGVREAALIPWELLRDPKTGAWLALHARSFVRTHSQAAQRPMRPATTEGKLRILLVICRPGRDDDVPFRSVASRLLKGLDAAARESFELDLLRPPTYDRLGQVLRQARARGEPYHVVHFDGHGAYGGVEHRDPALLLSAARAGEHGYLVFENPEVEGNRQYVDGPTLGRLLVETGAPVLVLNACRSAYAEPPTAPAAAAQDNPHTEVRTYGSLAQEVMDQGLAAVVANRYNIYVQTAAQFIGELYAGLVSGYPVSEAASLARKHLAEKPLRGIAYAPRPFQDWLVPLVWEAAPHRLFLESAKLTFTLGAGEAPERGALDPALPQPPDAGFFGRDETLLKLDRAFDTQPIVLLHAWAGSGKTATAAEFARWYALTGGLEGPVLFTSFEQHKPLARVLDEIERVLGGWLESQGVHWLALPDSQRRNVALQVLRQMPVLWIWDNVEPVAGFPRGTPSAWSGAEQKELADFLRAARGTKAKFLLTSRRDEHDWLGRDLPARITLPPMPMPEMLEMTRELARRHQRRIEDVHDWRPLLHFTQGNPLTLTVLVGQALRDGLKTVGHIGAFVERLRKGEAVFEDEVSEGRTRSLGASLKYGFENAFSESERRQLALLHLFQGFVDVDALKWMGNPEADWRLPEAEGLTREAGIPLLDRAAEIGLLTAHGGGYYGIHPALPWFFRQLFEEHYAGREIAATRAFVEAMGELGNYYWGQYEHGNREVIDALTAEEASLLHARRLARQHGWWRRIISTMQGLRTLYGHTGRRAEWKRLVEEIVPDFVDPATDGPLPGREENWSLVTEYRVRLAREARNWPEAERLQRSRVAWTRERAATALSLPPENLDAVARNTIRSLAVSLSDLGEIQREQGQPACADAFEEDLQLSLRIHDGPGAAISAFNLGTAYKNVASLRDLDQAESWYRRSLDLHSEADRLGQAKCHNQLGYVAWERFNETRSPAHLSTALGEYLNALGFLPSSAVNDLAVTHHQLGNIYGDAGDIDRALHHYREAIRYREAAGDLYGTASTQFNVALALAQAGRLADALEYAEAARRNFETFGDRAQADLQKTWQLIAQIQADLAGTQP